MTSRLLQRKGVVTMKFLLLVALFSFISGVKAQSIIVKPYQQNGSPNGMTIMWETNGSGTGYLDWGTSAGNLSQNVSSSSVATDGSNRLHTAKITGLQAATTYHYRVRMQSGTQSSTYKFKTHPTKASEQSVKFVAMSDMQRDGGNPTKFQEMVDQGVIPTANTNYSNGVQDLDGIIVPGDLVVTGTYSSWRDSFFALGDDLLAQVPLYPVPGNHEYYSSGLPKFLQYMDLPTNGSSGNLERWWYKDISNVRIVGFDSNANSTDQATQLTWLDGVLSNAASDSTIDFVFAQLHHPHKSELWGQGEIGFTGEVIKKLEAFTTTTGKASIHFFGHTHGYSRGQSRDHKHLWVNAATAGGNIDYWNEGNYIQRDYDEFVMSEAAYGFVFLEVEAGADPKFVLKRYSRGDEHNTKNNTLSDQITIKRFDTRPAKPVGQSPSGSVEVSCVQLKASAFSNGSRTHQATHWQVVEGSNFSASNVKDIWKQHMNWYNKVNTQLNDDLTDEQLITLDPNKTYSWRVRYRNDNLSWSEWSDPISFTTTPATAVTGNLLQNGNAENGITGWTGAIESLSNNACGSVPAYSGSKFFAVGGVCSNEQALGLASQSISVSTYANAIDTNTRAVSFSGYLRNYGGTDIPEVYVEFLNETGVTIGTSNVIRNTTATWTKVMATVPVVSGTRSIKMVLKGNRKGGTDNDSYFDDLNMHLVTMNCNAPPGNTTQNLLKNGDAEQGTTFWAGDIESLNSNQCDAVPVYAGAKLFAVGGICSNEKALGTATQLVDVLSYASTIDTGNQKVELEGYLRNYGGVDIPSMYMEFLNGSNGVISTSTSVSNNTASWTNKKVTATVPGGTRSIKVILKGTRNGGTDNDSYFDNLTLKLLPVEKSAIIVSNSTVEKEEVADVMELYPNPTRNKLMYKGAAKIDRLLIFDTQGRRVMQMTNVHDGATVALTSIQSGVYMAQLIVNDIIVKTIKFVKLQ